MHRGCADRVVNLHHPFDELDAEADQEPRDNPMITEPTGLTSRSVR